MFSPLNTPGVNEQLFLAGGEWRVGPSAIGVRSESTALGVDCRIDVPIQREWGHTFLTSFVVYAVVTLCGLLGSILGVSPPPVLGARSALPRLDPGTRWPRRPHSRPRDDAARTL